MIDVRQIRSGEWERLRNIRLEALADSPLSFATRLSEAEAYPESLWKERALVGAAGDEQATVLAVSGERTVGMTIALGRRGIPEGIVPIVSVFVSPTARRRGVAGRLLCAAEQWAVDHGGSSTSLWVEEGNAPARRLYESAGYVATTDREPMRSRQRAWEIRMEKALIAVG
jgi:GNAT superfamily N-acetyltransferase